jgi:nucleotide-binding universal stress UspA family protein
MYNKILAPLDGSPMAECTIEHVKEIAKGCSIPEVVFLFVVDISKTFYWAAEEAPVVQLLQQAEDAQREGGEEYLKKVVAKAKEDGLVAKGVIVQGSPADSIVDYAEKNGIDIIVMSTHGRSGVTRFALGSVTDKVIRTVSMPVLVVTPAECKVKI